MDLIDREELMRQIRLQVVNRSSLGETSCRELTFGEMVGLIVDSPTVDAEPVVRCKECRYFNTGVLATDFCSYGVRKDGD